MKKKIILITYIFLFISAISYAQTLTGPQGEKFAVRIVANKLSDPWEIIWGPDNQLWVTESHGYRVSKIDPATGKKTVLLDINDQRQFPRYDKLSKQTGGKPWPQAGLMGMALHPDLLKGKPYVYIAYIYRFAGADSSGRGCKINKGGCYFTTRIARYTYNSATQQLTSPVNICDSIPGSNDHNGGRLLIAPLNGKNYLFYSIGDMGAGQFDNGARPNHAQQPAVYEGKILRFNTLPDAGEGSYDAWIPNDNPFNQAGRQNAVYSLGHRNPQGLAYGVVNGTGRIYSSEHGPFSDDEVNIIEKGKNYGHPLIIGYNDNNYNGLAAGVSNDSTIGGKWHTSYPLIKSEHDNARALGTDYRDPLITLYPNSNVFLSGLFQDIKDGKGDFAWPSEAPSSIDVYTSSAIPGWKNSLLLTTLKGGKLIRLKLNAAGDKITGDTINYAKGKNRYRDLAISPDGKKIYLAVDSAGNTSGPSKENPQQIDYKGCIIEIAYTGQSDTGNNTGPDKLPAAIGTELKKKRPAAKN